MLTPLSRQVLFAAAAGVLLAGCEIVDTGRDRIGGASCGFSDAPPGTPEYRACTTRNAGEPRTISRTPGGSVF
jgi:hypothetical protein